MPESNEDRIKWLEETIALLIKNQQQQLDLNITFIEGVHYLNKEMGVSRQIEAGLSDVLLALSVGLDDATRNKIKGGIHIMKTGEEFRQDRIAKTDALLKALRKPPEQPLPG